MPLPPTEGSNHPVEVHPSLPGLGRVGAAASAPAVPTPVGSIAAVPLPPALSAAPTPVALLRALQRRWALALVLGVLGASIAATASWYLVPPPKYTARVMLHVWMKQPKVLFETQENRSDYRTYQKTQVTLIGSRTVLEDALRQPEVAKLPLVREQVDPLEWLHEEIKAEFPGDSEVLVISMSASKRAKDVATLVNAVSDAYLRKIVEQEDRARLMRLEQIREIYAGFQKDLDVKRKRLKGLVESVGANDKQAITVQQRMALEQLGLAKEQRMHLQAELRRAQVEVAVQEAKEKAAQAQPIPASEIDGLIAQDASVRLYREQIQKYTDQYHYLKGKVRSERDPSLLSALQSLEAARRGLVARYAELRPTITEQLRAKDRGGKDGTSEQLRTQIAILAEYDAGLEKTIEELSDQTRAYNRESHELQTQQDDIVVVTEVAKKVGAEVGAMDIELKAPPRIEVVEKASSPRRQDELKKIKLGFCNLSGCDL